MSQEPSDLLDDWMLISRFEASGQWERLLDASQNLLAREPENSRGHLAAARALVNLSRHSQAHPHLQQVLAKQPENDVAHRMTAMVHFHEKRFKAADDSIHKAISLDPHSAYHWYFLADMFRQKQDLVNAKKYAQRARELAPRDPDILNLVAMCQPLDGLNSSRSLRQYHQALEIDPENAVVHNNVGAYHINVDKDYVKAEECFRRALFFDPSLKIARENLLVALKRRDRVYKWLSAPKDLVLQFIIFMGKKQKQSVLLYLLVLPLWMVSFRFILFILAAWCLLVWPLVKAYEYLTIGDIQNRAGEIGARRGGLFGYRRWTLGRRLSIFAILLASFWGAFAFLIWQVARSSYQKNPDAVYGTIVFLAIGALFVWWISARSERLRFRFFRKRTKQFDRLLKTNGKHQ